jgi:membrane protease YdiL (CAAX protease family)
MPVAGSPAPPAGWYADPWRAAPYRWWDGNTWTHHTHGAYFQQWHPTPATARRVDDGPRARDDLRGFGIAVLGFAGAMSLALIFQKVAAIVAADPQSTGVEVAGSIGLWSGLLMATYVIAQRNNCTLRDLGVRAPTAREIGLGIGVAFVALMIETRVVYVLRELLPPENRGIGSNVFVEKPSGAALVAMAIIVCIGAPIFEEIFFRGAVQPTLIRPLGVGPAIFTQALLFGCAHYQLSMTAQQAIVRIVAITIIGLFLGYLRYSTGRLGASMVTHATNNTIVVLVAFAALWATN